MSRSVNKVIIIGTLGRDPELKYLPSGSSVVNLSVATDEGYNDKNTGQKVDKTEWHRIKAFGKLAEIMNQYLKKGSKVYFEGKLSTSEYEKDGIKRYSTEIIANEMTMLDSRQDSGMNNGYGNNQSMNQPMNQSMQQPTQQPMQQPNSYQPQGQNASNYSQQPQHQQQSHAQQAQQQAPMQQPGYQSQPAQSQGYSNQPAAPAQQPVPQPNYSQPPQGTPPAQQQPAQPSNGGSFDTFDDDIPF